MDGESDDGREMLYQVICLQNTPPESLDEQEQCMEARTACWRLRVAARIRRSA